MKQLLIVLSVLFSLTLSAQTVRVSYDESSQSIVFGNNRYKMVHVAGGSFMMGATPEQGGTLGEQPIHRVTLSDYYIGQTEVTQALWKAVMGNNPSWFKGNNRPVEDVSWDDCQVFIRKLNSMTGLRFRLPTEAEWEFAARGGNKSHGYKYSGSNSIGNVAVYSVNSWERDEESPDFGTHNVATMQANELGIYDMSGNVWEWCSDWDDYYDSSEQTNPIGPSNGFQRIIRGGGWHLSENSCRVFSRESKTPDEGDDNSIGLRLAFTSSSPQKNNVTDSRTNPLAQPRQQAQSQQPQTAKVSYDESSQSIVFGNNRYKMVHVAGGSFTMGATPEQGFDARDNEKPTHRVTLSDYHIGQTEVTQALWEAVMGNNPSWFKGNNRPVEDVSWNDCQDFIRRLNSMTGKNFCLPTEAQWEFAARGGNKSRGYKYSGSNSLGNIAVYEVNAYDVGKGSSDYGTHDVATKQANELGIYDMSGNVWEWCSDWRGDYGNYAQTNPTGPYGGPRRVNRGGGWAEENTYCRVAYRESNPPDYTYKGLGLRLALVPYSTQNTFGTQGNQEATVAATMKGKNDMGEQNDHEWVDLGLSVKWATCNVGASKPEEYGNYYAWGETRTKSKYNPNTYFDLKDGVSKYKKKTLSLSDDAAHVNWGGSWRMPTIEEQIELQKKCIWTWTTQNGVKGRKVVGPNGNSIFLPAAGYRDNSGFYKVGSIGSYWSSSLKDDSIYAYYIFFTSGYVDRGTGSSRPRCDGLPVRAVCP